MRLMQGVFISALAGFLGLSGASGAALLPNPAYPVGANPFDLVMADFNGDGIQDLVASNPDSSSSLSLLYGLPDGTFANAIRYPTIVRPRDLYAADLNGDGWPDLVLSGESSPSVLLNRGPGVGNFSPEMLVTSGFPFPLVRLGDFDADGRPDLLAFGLSANILAMRVMFGIGNGTFRQGPLVPTGGWQDIAVADMDEDGRSDVLITTFDGFQTNELIILSGLGNGKFKQVFTLATGDFLADIIPMDLNADGHADLAINRCAIIANSCHLIPMLLAYGRGNGSLEPVLNFETRPGLVDFATGDINLDGRTDFVEISHDGNDDSLGVYLAFGDGSFAPQKEIYAGNSDNRVICHDFDGNGTPDLAILSHSAESIITMFGNGDGTFGPRQAFSPESMVYNAAAVADFNSDGKLDLVMGEYSDQGISIVPGDGDGTWNDGTPFPSGTGPTAILAADFNGDDNPDVAVAASEWIDQPSFLIPPGSLTIHFGDGMGGLQRGATYLTGPNPHAVARGDFNGDGKLDLIVLNGVGASIFLGTGHATFTPSGPISVGEFASDLTVGDFNRDGHADLVVSSRGHYSNLPPFNRLDGNVSILLGRGDGTFSAPTVAGSLYSASGVASADLNGDGNLDLAVSDEGDLQPTQRGGLRLFFGRGDGQFLAGGQYTAGVGPQDVRIADFNGDGIDDLALPNNGGDESVLLGRGSGAFSPELRFGLLANPEFILNAEFNRQDRGILSGEPFKRPGAPSNPPIRDVGLSRARTSLSR